MEEPQFIIYGLVDPRDGQIRYVGQSSSGMRGRPTHHAQPAKIRRAGGRLGSWSRKLVKLNTMHTVILLETVKQREGLDEAEIWNIAYYRHLGYDLTNETIGGKGMHGYVRKPSSIAKTVACTKGIPRPDWVKEKIRKTQLGVSHPKRIQGQLNWFKANPVSNERKLELSIQASRPIVCSDGRDFPSIKAAAAQIGISYNSIFNNLRKNKVRSFDHKILGQDIGFAYPEPPPRSKRSKPHKACLGIVCSDGRTFISTQQASEATGVSAKSIGRSLRINSVGRPTSLIKKYQLGFARIA